MSARLVWCCLHDQQRCTVSELAGDWRQLINGTYGVAWSGVRTESTPDTSLASKHVSTANPLGGVSNGVFTRCDRCGDRLV